MLRHRLEDEDEEEEGEIWLASYSDLITDLLAVFVLLYSFALLTQGVGKAADKPAISGSVVSSQVEETQEYEGTVTDRIIEELRRELKEAELDEKVAVIKVTDNLIKMRFTDSVFFDTGKADIKDEARPELDMIIDILEKYDELIHYIHIEGHTDSVPIHTATYPSNWELSTGRAGSVVRYFLENSRMDPAKFSSAGYGEYRPIAGNDTPEGRAQNRRVEFNIELDAEAAWASVDLRKLGFIFWTPDKTETGGAEAQSGSN